MPKSSAIACSVRAIALTVIATGWGTVGRADETTPEAAAFFESKVRPLLATHCYKCHGDAKQESALRLDSRAAMLAGGESGPAIVPGKPAESTLFKAVSYQGYEMPPTGKLKAGEVAVLAEWIKLGAPWPGATSEGALTPRKQGLEITAEDRLFWSFRKVERPPPPGLSTPAYTDATTDVPPPCGPIDAFVREKLADAGLSPSPQAEPRVLVRRLFFDLIGLPPTLGDVERFTADISPDAYERLADKLLASPQFGERWGRHWLDVVRYAQTNGYERDDEKPFAWRYRDYVIRATNADKPYDRFVQEQLAGDELSDTLAKADDDAITATAYYRLGVWDDEPDDRRAAEFDELDDIVSTTGATFLGLSIGCARCHDHKFDPLPQEDYYQLLAFVRNIALYGKEASPTHLASNTEGHMLPLPSGKGKTLAVRERAGEILPTHVLARGNAASPTKEVSPHFPRVFDTGSISVESSLEAPSAAPKGAGRRRALAEWITRRDHPLTARVMANRVWQYHFGRGIVATPSDFGKIGDRPSHPALLDFLAAELVDGDWQLKRLHRMMVNSSTYRQSSASTDPRAIAKNPDNSLLWRQNLRRLDAEAIRDAVLSASGELNLAMTGPSFYPTLGPEVLASQSRPGNGWGKSPPDQQARRSVYMFVKRTLGVPLMEVFDAAATDKPTPTRTTTTVAPQALTLLNSDFFSAQAEALARRAAAASDINGPQWVSDMFRRALARAPSEAEMQVALAYLDRQATASRAADPNLSADAADRLSLAALAKVVLNLNEFVYID